MDTQVVDVNVPGRARQGIQIGVARDGEDKLVSLAIIVAVVAIVGLHGIILVAVRVLLCLIRARGPQLQHLLLERPRATTIVRKCRRHRFVNVLRTPVEIALQMLPAPGDDREIVRLHPLRARIPDLIPLAVAVAGRLQANRCAGLLQSPAATGNVGLARRSIAFPTRVIFVSLRREGGNKECGNCRGYNDCSVQGKSSSVGVILRFSAGPALRQTLTQRHSPEINVP